ncbi:MAG: hypothetical protein AAF371_14505 [Pseudomonadota bacterium]
MVLTGTAAVLPGGRITSTDPCLWDDDQIAGHAASAQTAPGVDTDPATVADPMGSDDLDIVLLGRQLLADPHWPAKAAATLDDDRPVGDEQSGEHDMFDAIRG